MIESCEWNGTSISTIYRRVALKSDLSEWWQRSKSTTKYESSSSSTNYMEQARVAKKQVESKRDFGVRSCDCMSM
jgi:hypothetical protein